MSCHEARRLLKPCGKQTGKATLVRLEAFLTLAIRFATREKENDSGLFAVGGRFNHACRPANNIEFFYDKKLGCLVLTVVTQTVRKGEELTICYGPDRSPYQLWYQYGFRCQCGACPGFSDHELQELDRQQWYS